jgi:hypothetical protein
MDKKEVYFYGTLLALVKEQNDAFKEQKENKLGWWGRARMPERDKAIVKFANKIIQYKINKYRTLDKVVDSVKEDMLTIEADKKVWHGINEEELNDVVNIFVQMLKNIRSV